MPYHNSHGRTDSCRVSKGSEDSGCTPEASLQDQTAIIEAPSPLNTRRRIVLTSPRTPTLTPSNSSSSQKRTKTKAQSRSLKKGAVYLVPQQHTLWTVPATRGEEHPTGTEAQQVPVMSFPPCDPVSTWKLPAVMATKRRSVPPQQPALLSRLWSLMFSREVFEDLSAQSSVPPELSATDRRIVAFVDKFCFPMWARQWMFHLLDFFTRRRVYLALLTVVITVFLALRLRTLSTLASTFIVAEESRPGLLFYEKYHGGNRTPPHKHPVVIVPGFITAALEVWESGSRCVTDQSIFSYFRQRMFGPQMIYLILKNPQCWLDMFSMDKQTGLDKPGVKIRADSGFASVDYFMPGYWVWAKVLINLADIGYDPQSMAIMTYDWRLSPAKSHERDGFFYTVRNGIKSLCQKNRERAVVISHSYGTTVALAFFTWADQREPGFMDKYVAYFVNIGGTTMGLPKALASTLLGDVRDTVTIPVPVRRILDTFISQEARYNFTRTWSCLTAMLPHSCVEEGTSVLHWPNGTTMGVRDALLLQLAECRRTGHDDAARELEKHLAHLDDLPVLPQAPHTTVVCLYGVDRPSEVGYVLEEGRLATNTSFYDHHTLRGVRQGSGDSTVPLMSLAYMCRAPNGWKENVGRVVTIEHQHVIDELAPFNLRGGSQSANHVDILGNHDLLETILKIVSGIEELGANENVVEYVDPITGESHMLRRRLKDRIFSDVDERIEVKMQSCLRKKNIHVTPRKSKEKNPFT